MALKHKVEGFSITGARWGIYGANMQSVYKVENAELKKMILGLASGEAILKVTYIHRCRNALADELK